MHRCYAPHAFSGIVELDADQAHHIATVLRLASGATVGVFDGRGREWAGRLVRVSRGEVVVELGEPRAPAAEPPVAVTLAVGLLKGDQMSQVVRDATALGVVRIIPVLSKHTAAVRPSAWADQVHRWRRIAIAATAQSGRAVVPDIDEVRAFEEVIETAASGLLMCVEPARAGGQADTGPRPAAATLLTGPEGGWAEHEVAGAVSRGGRLMHLGPRTLRAELAPAVALASLWTSWGWE